MKKISALILAVCMILTLSQPGFALVPGDEVVVGRDGFSGDVGGDRDWYTSDNASGMHYENKGIVSNTNKGAVAGEVGYTLSADGEYELFWFYSGWSQDTGVCTISIPTAGGKATVQVVTNAGKGWKSIGKYELLGGEQSLTLQTDGGQVRFSGFKAVYKSFALSFKNNLFAVDNSKKTVTGILKNMTVAEFAEKMNIPEGCTAAVVGKSDGDIVENGDVLKIEAASGEAAEYSLEVNMDIIVKGYTLSGNEISAVAYATYVYDFLENIIIPNAVTAKVFTGDGENTEIVRDGDVLRVSANGTETEYNISVLPASGEKDITSTEYSVFENEISGIPYNTSLSEFLEKITVPEYAAVSHHYEQGYTGAVYTGDEITVTAQNGDSKVYVLKVENGRTTADISGAAGIEINKKTGVISGAEKGESVSDFLSALTVTNGGKIKLYSADGEEKTSGVLSGGETVRVFPEYSTPGAEFDIYTVSCNSKLIGDSEIIVTVEDDGYSTNGDCYESGTAVEPGYNGITTVYPSNCTGRFTWQVTKSGAYSVYMYTSYHSSNKPYKAQLHSADGTEEATVHQEETSGWKLLGKYAFSAGEDGYIDITNDEGDNSGYARLSAVKIVPEGEYKNISDVALISENGEEKLREGVNRVKSLEGAKIKLTADAKIEKEDIKITSEYGNSLDFTLSEKDGAAMILPKYDLRKEVTYYISVNSEKLSKPYTYVLQHEKKISAAVALRVVNGTATVSLDAKNSGNGDETLTVFVCSFSDAFTMRECVVKSLTVSAGTEETITEKIGVESEGSVKVFLWDSVMNPVTKVYYR